jgi:hypothetical protein
LSERQAAGFGRIYPPARDLLYVDRDVTMAQPSRAAAAQRLLDFLRSADDHPSLVVTRPPVTLAALASMTGMFLPDCRRALDDLVRAGILEVQVHDRGVLQMRLMDPPTDEESALSTA